MKLTFAFRVFLVSLIVAASNLFSVAVSNPAVVPASESKAVQIAIPQQVVSSAKDFTIYPTASFTATGTTVTPSSGYNTGYTYFTEVTFWVNVSTGVSATVYITPQLSNDGVNWVDFNTANSMTFVTTDTQYATVSVVSNKMRLEVTKSGEGTVKVN